MKFLTTREFVRDDNLTMRRIPSQRHRCRHHRAEQLVVIVAIRPVPAGANSATSAPASRNCPAIRSCAARISASTLSHAGWGSTATRKSRNRSWRAGGRCKCHPTFGKASGPAMISSVNPRSAAVRACGPWVAIGKAGLGHCDPGKCPVVGMMPLLGLWPNRPQNAAGTRIDPPRSLPRSNGVNPAASVADPPELPPGVRRASHGLSVRPYTGLSA